MFPLSFRHVPLLAILLLTGLGVRSTSGQVVVYSPVSPVVSAPVNVYYPIQPAVDVFAPPSVATYRQVTIEPTVVPAPAVVTYRVPVTTYSPVTAVTSYSPVVTAYAPVTTYAYSPVTTYAPAVAIPVGTPVIVRPKVYVPGEPILNLIRAVTP